MQHKELSDLSELVKLRQELHKYPDLSGQESETAARIVKHLQNYNPDKIYTQLGGTGVAAVFYGEKPDGPTILFRAELDALPIVETNEDLNYRSVREGTSHKCGHDGHMAILTALGSLLHQKRSASGKVILLYQPAEETGAGAWAVLQDSRFETGLKPDYVFALHNIPGKPMHQVIVREDVFAPASTGMIVELHGKSSHAAEPENGLNPGLAMAEIIVAFNEIISNKEQFQDLALLTVIHARLGEVAFGTNPGFATVMATLRSYQPTDMQRLKELTQQCVQQIAANYKLTYNISFIEDFPATVNHSDQVQSIRKAAANLELDVQEAVQPFRWSEDFGHFTARYKGAFFGLGSGTQQPQLHHADYDFPDELIPTGAAMFYGIIQQILNK
ncbi:amidohydrolase [Pontibacter sp. BT310]|uniref:Amidohydrolase n=1 Tax=Pontibacter populi TaxID=890055 RepID=A0ABS6X9R5_9BACT|nr:MULTISPECIES: amidohydrolase [Pontibacter]MBJ6117887.1 amidohydrolase [Pontibacter sp. BT310]MBR0570314.1 amidohydrolase [Microvirga sp. STS03]MBW3364740.1 amidohydrolase [Pontibacter populi]